MTAFENSELTYASIGRRLIAALIDGLIVSIVGTIALYGLPVVGSIFVWLLYAPFLESSEVRATLGKKLMGIQVVNLDGTQLSFRSALIRNLIKIISGAVMCLGFIVALFTRKNQALHDLLSDTLVVQGESETPVVDAWVSNTKRLFDKGLGELETPTVNRESIVTQLERLQRLRNQGTIDEAEFEAAKSRLLT